MLLAVLLAACGGGGDEAPAPAAAKPRQWQGAAATETVPANQYSGTPRIAADGDGNLLMVYLRYDSGRRDAMAQRFDKASGRWSAPVPIESGDGTVNYGDIALAVDARGNGIAVWSQVAGATQRSDLWTNRFDAATGTWGSAALLENNDSGSALLPQVAFDGKGNAFAVWLASGGATSDVWAARWDAASKTWAAPALLETDAGAPHFPQIAADANGNALAVWHQDFGATAQIRVSRYTAGTVNAWGAAEGIATYGQGAGQVVRLAMNAAGHAVAVWEHHQSPANDIGASRFDALTQTWSAPVLLESSDSRSANPRVTVDADGHVMVVWQQLDGLHSLWASRWTPSSTAWSAPERIENDDVGNTTDCVLAVAASGEVFAVWQAGDGTLNNIWANRYIRDGGWGEAALIETTSIGQAQLPALAVSAGGEAMAVWSQADGSASSSIWANGFR